MKPIKQVSILVAGDIGVDEYLMGEVKRISPEAPVPIISNPIVEKRLGMAANVAANIEAMGGNAGLLGIIGADENGRFVESAPMALHLIIDAKRATIRKTRIIGNNKQFARIDLEETGPHRKEQLFISELIRLLPYYDALVIQDYGKGIWTENSLKSAIGEANKLKKPVFVDPARNARVEFYNGATLIKANKEEAEKLTGEAFLSEQLDVLLCIAQHVVVTLGSEGMAYSSRTMPVLQFSRTTEKSVSDVTGAGDTAIAAIALAYCEGQSIDECVDLANRAAGVAVSKFGTSIVRLEDLEEGK